MRRPKLIGSFATGAALAGVVALSCAPLGGPMDGLVNGLPADPAHPLLLCDPVERRDTAFTISGGAGPSTVMLPGGHRLDIPANALAPEDTREITFWQRPGRTVSIELNAPGEFNDSLTLTLSYADRGGCEVDQPQQLWIYRVGPPYEQLPRPGQPANRREVSGRLIHFSAFAIAR